MAIRDTARDFTGQRIEIGDRVKIQGASDHTLPIYLILEHGVVVGFGRTRVILNLDQYPGREVRVLPQSLRHEPPENQS